MKKVIGYIFIIISIILAIAIFGRIQFLIQDIITFVKVLSFKYDSYETTKAITAFVMWAFHFLLVVFLWEYGRNWTRKPKVLD